MALQYPYRLPRTSPEANYHLNTFSVERYRGLVQPLIPDGRR